MEQPVSLYLHVPFCEKKCHYCDFYSCVVGQDREALMNRYVRAVKTELLNFKSSVSENSISYQTMYWGGGTPSLLSVRFFEELKSVFFQPGRLSFEGEWTVEVNPSSVTLEKLRCWKNAGVNRISVGVQSFDSGILGLLGRVHDSAQARQALEWIFESGFDNVSVDLLCGVPGQTRAQLDESFHLALQFPITHLSVYLLTLESPHPLWKRLPDENNQLEQLLWIHETLCERGFEHYEVSNFCKPGYRSRHNMNYWLGGSYMGFGPSAHSYDSLVKRRWSNVSQLESYLQIIERGHRAIEWEEFLSPVQIENERWMLCLRTSEGVHEGRFDTPERKKWLNTYYQQGFMGPHPQKAGFWILTPRGLFLMDQLVTSFWVA